LQGSAKVNLGLENFEHQQGTVSFTFPKQLFSKENQSQDFFGYYLFFTEEFLSDWISASNLVLEYSFFSYTGQPFFQLNQVELEAIKAIIEKINQELHTENIERKKAVKLYLQLLLTYLKRSYKRQGFEENIQKTSQQAVVFRFKKLVSEHFLTYRNVSDYAEMLAITPNYLNRIVKQETLATASYFINQMLLTEARALLKHSDMSISEIAFHLSFSDVAHFSNFFKQHLNISPTQYRK